MKVKALGLVFGFLLLGGGCMPRKHFLTQVSYADYVENHVCACAEQGRGQAAHPITADEILRARSEGLSDACHRHLSDEVRWMRVPTSVFDVSRSKSKKTRALNGVECFRQAGVAGVPVLLGKLLQSAPYYRSTVLEFLEPLEAESPFAEDCAAIFCELPYAPPGSRKLLDVGIMQKILLPLIPERESQVRLKYRFVGTLIRRLQTEGIPWHEASLGVCRTELILRTLGRHWRKDFWGVYHIVGELPKLPPYSNKATAEQHVDRLQREAAALRTWWNDNQGFLYWDESRDRFEVNEAAKATGLQVDPAFDVQPGGTSLNDLPVASGHAQPPPGHSWCRACGRMIPIHQAGATQKDPLWACTKCGNTFRGVLSEKPKARLLDRVKRADP